MRRTILLAFMLYLVGSTLTATAADKPNIVLMLSDDQAWNGLSVPMHPEVAESRGRFYSTPNLERLAAQGMRFSQAYAPAPVCSPTRISLQTGMSPAQLHWTKAAPPVEGMKLIEPHLIKNIGDDVVTIGELLRDAGYATAHYGKWHIGGGGPGRHGYEEHDGDTGNENAAKFVDPNPVDIFGMADRAEQFMAKAKRDRKPFFIQLSWNALHASENASKAALAKYEKLMSVANEKAISTAAITEDLDRGVGRVLDSIDKLALKDSTYVIYMSDNGAGGGSAGGNAGGGKRGGLRGGKGGVWEGGLRVPFIIRGPGIAADAWCHVPIVGYDLFPTFAALACIPKEKIPARVEGEASSTCFIEPSKVQLKQVQFIVASKALSSTFLIIRAKARSLRFWWDRTNWFISMRTGRMRCSTFPKTSESDRTCRELCRRKLKG
ncbi:MAG: sulfatase-like hydrolase/transferase [Pirellulales bacterium]